MSEDPVWSDHLRIDERSLALHKVIAERLRDNPNLLEIARKNLQRWFQQHGETAALLEWKKILDGPLEDILALLASPSEKARQLRQSSPFCGILTHRERWALYEPFSIGTHYKGSRQHHGRR